MKADLLQFGSLLTWWWLPSFGSQLLVHFLYSSHIATPPPPSAHRLRNNHLQLARAVVVIGTLLYQLFQSATTAAPNYYQLLALPLHVDSEGVKRSFRALARRYHPDKVGEQGEAFFIVLRKAHDALSDPVRRFAYDRFGPAVVEWKDCESSRDFMRRGLTSLVAFYTINPAMYAAVGYISSSGTRSDGLSFWRLACLFSLLAFELRLLVSPEYPTWLTLLLPNTTIHDVRQLAHSLFVNFFFASLQLSAALDVLEYGQDGAPARDRKNKAVQAERQLAAIKGRAQVVDTAAEAIKARMLQKFALELRPLRADVGEKLGGGGEGGREMGEVEERVFERIDAVLLCRSLVQQHPSLALMAEKRVDDEVVEKMEKKEEGEEEPLIRAKEKPLEEVLPEPETTVKAEEATSTVQDCLSSTQVKTEAVDEDPLVIGTADQTDEAVVAPEAKLTNEQVVVPATMDQTESGPLLQTSHPASAPDRATQVELTQQDAAAASTEPSTAVQPTVQQSTEAEAPTTAPTSNDDSAQANAPKDRPIASALSDSS